MYLMTITLLVIGVLGIYAQVLSTEAARFAAQQNGLAFDMMLWHDAAVSMGASLVDRTDAMGHPIPQLPTWATNSTNPFCSLTATNPIASGFSAPYCPAPTGEALKVGENGTVTDAAGALNFIENYHSPSGLSDELVHLPSDYQTTSYQFKSVLFRDAQNNSYVVTYVDPPAALPTNPPPRYITLPALVDLTGGVRMTSFTMADLQHQLQVSDIPIYCYGTVQTIGGVSTLVTTSLQYSLPMFGGAGIIPNGSIALISSTSGL